MDVSILESTVNKNIAEHGGGLFWSSGGVEIIGCTIKGNEALGTYMSMEGFYDNFYGGGGGMLCWSSEANIENCFISDNKASGSGGGVYFGGDPNVPVLKNCLVKGNSAVLDGGGIVSYWFVTPKISNCTIVDNTAFDPFSLNHGRGGGLSCSYESETFLTDSILWGNTGTLGNQIAIGSDDEPFNIDRPATLNVSHCDIQGGNSPQSIFYEPGRILNWLGGNIDADPLFVGQYYYLSQTAAGQAVDSPCVDAGSDLATALGLGSYTTRSDGVNDVNVVDIGIHYPAADGHHQYFR